jgi:hypothetical protein
MEMTREIDLSFHKKWKKYEAEIGSSALKEANLATVASILK